MRSRAKLFVIQNKGSRQRESLIDQDDSDDLIIDGFNLVYFLRLRFDGISTSSIGGIEKRGWYGGAGGGVVGGRMLAAMQSVRRWSACCVLLCMHERTPGSRKYVRID
jgi:hypothetical protein